VSNDPDTKVSNDPNTKDLMEFYKEICASIRATDEISFKILGAVPVISALGSGALTYLKPDCQLAVPFIVLSLIFALVTVGLFMWELRNIQKCKWLIARAARIEEQIQAALRLPEKACLPFYHSFKGELGDLAATSMDGISLSSKGKWCKMWGKTEAAKLIYVLAFLAWLVPAVMAMCALYGCYR
jgi:hypothetical protein